MVFVLNKLVLVVYFVLIAECIDLYNIDEFNSKFKEILLDLFSTPKMQYFALYHRPSSG